MGELKRKEHKKRKDMITTVEDAVAVFTEWLSECDVDDFCASFDHTFSTSSTYDAENEEITIVPADGYGGILDEF